jgi:hypothetical protein
MKEERLKELLDKYYLGETSEAEETELKEYFRRTDIIEGYEAESHIFCHYLKTGSIPEPSAGFTERIAKAIDELENPPRREFKRKRYIIILSSAAAILLLIGTYFIFLNQKDPEDTFTDPQLAYAETMRILNEVSVRLNKGTEALKPINKLQYMSTGINSMERSTDIISKNLKRIKILEGIPDGGNQLNKKNSDNIE